MTCFCNPFGPDGRAVQAQQTRHQKQGWVESQRRGRIPGRVIRRLRECLDDGLKSQKDEGAGDRAGESGIAAAPQSIKGDRRCHGKGLDTEQGGVDMAEIGSAQRLEDGIESHGHPHGRPHGREGDHDDQGHRPTRIRQRSRVLEQGPDEEGRHCDPAEME